MAQNRTLKTFISMTLLCSVSFAAAPLIDSYADKLIGKGQTKEEIQFNASFSNSVLENYVQNSPLISEEYPIPKARPDALVPIEKITDMVHAEIGSQDSTILIRPATIIGHVVNFRVYTERYRCIVRIIPENVKASMASPSDEELNKVTAIYGVSSAAEVVDYRIKTVSNVLEQCYQRRSSSEPLPKQGGILFGTCVALVKNGDLDCQGLENCYGIIYHTGSTTIDLPKEFAVCIPNPK
jgi:hypothetical protein